MSSGDARAARRLIAPLPADVAAGAVVALSDEAAHYARDVLRLRAGAAVELCDGAGRVVAGRLEVDAGARSRGARVLVERAVAVPPPVGPRVTLCQGLGKGDKVDDVFRAAAELGARRLIPVRTSRAVPEGAGRRARWRGIAEDAIRVSGRAWLPEVSEVRALAEVLAEGRDGVALDGGGGRALLPWLSERAGAAEVWLLVGPEGGFTDEERGAIEAAGWSRATLGAHTLRTETAGIAAMALAAAVLLG